MDFAWTAASRQLNQCKNIVNWTLAFEIVVWEMAAILSRPQCVNGSYTWMFAPIHQGLWDNGVIVPVLVT